MAVGVERNAAVVRRVDHQRKGSVKQALAERLEVAAFHIDFVDGRRSSVLSGNAGSVGHEVLDAGCNVQTVDMIRVVSLIASAECLAHLSIDKDIFAKAFPDSRPGLVDSEVHSRVKSPWDHRCASLVGANIAHFDGIFTVKRGCKAYFLRKNCCTCSVGRSVILVQTVEARNSDFPH